MNPAELSNSAICREKPMNQVGHLNLKSIQAWLEHWGRTPKPSLEDRHEALLEAYDWMGRSGEEISKGRLVESKP